jgi:hypothetical protein
MKKNLALLVILGFAATPALAQKVNIDYAHDFDFDGVRTFTYVDTQESNPANPMMQERIVDAIKRELREGGLQEVSVDADLYVTSHITTKEKTVYNTTTFGYGGYGAGWYGWGGGMGSSTTTASDFTEGTLIIDAYEPADKKMVWRGTGTVTVKAKPEKQIKQVDKILSKLGDRWDKILAGQGK